MKVLMNMWPHFVLGHVGDYSASSWVSAMSKQFPDMQFEQVRSVSAVSVANMRALFLRGAQKLGLLRWNSPMLQPLYNMQCTSYLPDGYLRKVKPDVIFAHSHVPRLGEFCKTPLVAVEYIASERYMKMAGVLHCLPREIYAKRLAIEQAEVVLTTTPGSMVRLERYVPEMKLRLLQVPIYMPYVEPVTEDFVVSKSRDDQKIRILFVGATAHRKGLPQVLRAFRMLEKSVRDRFSFSVVSSFHDGPVTGIEREAQVFSGIHSSDVAKLMQEAHVFVFPTQYDSYGRVIVEAMSAGCGIICSNTDPQDWMLNYGKAGLLVDPNSAVEIAGALVSLAHDRGTRLNYALSALRRFREVFYHRVVGLQLRNAFEIAIKAKR